VDGRDYYWVSAQIFLRGIPLTEQAVSVALEAAKETIYIEDWWLSPELFLRRPAYYNQEWRLDQILKRKAEAGVKIFVIVYREVEVSVPRTPWPIANPGSSRPPSLATPRIRSMPYKRSAPKAAQDTIILLLCDILITMFSRTPQT
jgi:hypothetical protein